MSEKAEKAPPTPSRSVPEIKDVGDLVSAATSWLPDAAPFVGRWFRGQSKSSWELRPKLYRHTYANSPEKLLNLERHLMRDFRLMSASISPEKKTDSDLYFMAQHYGVPTRLLDWTTNPLIALYFACAGEPNESGKVFFLHANTLVKAKQPNGKPFGIATSRRIEFRAWIAHIFDWTTEELETDEKSRISENFPIRPEHFDRRITLQQGCFTFNVPKTPVLPEDKVAKAYVIPAPRKPIILKQLASLNIHHFTVFGDLPGLAKHLEDVHFRSKS